MTQTNSDGFVYLKNDRGATLKLSSAEAAGIEGQGGWIRADGDTGVDFREKMGIVKEIIEKPREKLAETGHFSNPNRRG